MPSLDHILRERIKREGPLTVAQYMAAALGHPQHGYYMTRDPFGRAGDFITAPEISQMFGELLGLWGAAVWQDMGRPRSVHLIELGPGRGTLMVDALRAVQRTVPAFYQALDVALVETSPVLRKHQEAALQTWAPNGRLAWHESFDTVAAGPGIVLANEFFDALPIRQYVKDGQTWRERRVGLDRDGGFCFSVSDPLTDISMIPERFRGGDSGSIFETCPEGEKIVGAISRRLAAHGGVSLIVDYGHAVSGLGDTVQAVKGQRYHDIFDTPGEADLTAHVDFQALADAARGQGAQIFGPVTQRVFLERIGIRQRSAALMEGISNDRRAGIQSALERLIGEGEMGTLFKVLAVAAPGTAVLPGFDDNGTAGS
ncbi:MAG: class I SAM-dependent methyltransferase [Rhodospirillales bacterium]